MVVFHVMIIIFYNMYINENGLLLVLSYQVIVLRCCQCGSSSGVNMVQHDIIYDIQTYLACVHVRIQSCISRSSAFILLAFKGKHSDKCQK